MPELHVLRVFCAEGGGGGNPLGVFLDGAAGPDGASPPGGSPRELGFSETVFVDDASAARCASSPRRWSCRSPGIRVVGTAWLLARERGAVQRRFGRRRARFRCARRAG